MISEGMRLATMLENLKLGIDDPSPLQLLLKESFVEQGLPYSAGWKFQWLLSDWDAPLWQTTAGEKTRKDPHGVWIDTSKAHWDILLPDGTMLTDKHHAVLLETCRRASALYRMGLGCGGRPPSISYWEKFNRQMIQLCNWMILEKHRYLPSEYGFQLLDQAGIKKIMIARAKGGWCEVNQLVPRSLTRLYEETFQQPVPQSILDDPIRLPSDYKEKITLWLSRNDGYARGHEKSRERVSRALIAKLICCSRFSLSGHFQLDAFLRQFESHQSSTLLATSHHDREYPAQWTITLEEAHDGRAGVESIKETVSFFKGFFMLYRHMPDRLPSPVGINFGEASSIAHKIASCSSHTPFIPIDTGLSYLNRALQWVVLYGDPLIDYYLTIMERIAPSFGTNTESGYSIFTDNYALEKVFKEIPLCDTLKKAGFSFSSLKPRPGDTGDFERFRSGPSLHEALEIFIGAVTVIIAILKPSRDIEITSLPRMCLLRSHDGNYWLDSSLGKRTVADRRARTGGKPIPIIAARAIQQVRKLNRGLVRIFNEKDQFKKNQLFYLPNARGWGNAIKLNSASLNPFLDSFCDYVGLPPDEFGRRWYIRIHEMRKWFLLLLFWSGRYDVLDASRWIAGHTDVKHLYAYIEREFPGGKLGKLEAECAIDQLAKYDESRVILDGENIGLVELHERILKHFSVNSLSFVKESEWRSLVEELFEHDYHLEPFAISTDTGDQKICVAIRVGPRGHMNEE
jgi:hypothetical protein